jgi:hypothetical protein
VADHGLIVLGLPIPSSSRAFLAVLGLHVAAGLSSVVAATTAILSRKGRGRHPRSGTVYYWSLVVVCATMTVLAVMRWPADNHLLALGVLALAAATIGRAAHRGSWRHWVRIHLLGMGCSFILLLTAFYVDNGPHLPLWRHLPTLGLWLAPSIAGLPILLWAYARHPLLRADRRGHGDGSALKP